jgi:uncharacterized protein
MTADQLIKSLDLKPHPEGGFFRETYRSDHSTAIYYLLVPGSLSKIHRLKSDEVFHFYMGDPVTWVQLVPGGKPKKTVLGPWLGQGQQVQMVVPANNWFGGLLNEGGNFALMGTTVSPGFEFKDFELGRQEDLLTLFPKAKEEILRLT